MRRMLVPCFALIMGALMAHGASALTIYDIQYSTPPDYSSPYDGQTVTVTGGIVTKIFVGGSTKITIQDPTLGDAWAGIQVVFSDHGQAAGIVFGDQVDFYDVVVDEYRGNTQLLFSATSMHQINTSGHVVEPLLVTTADIAYPPNHDVTEKYEYMLLKLEDVTVGAMDLGKNEDNYELTNADGTCWGSDYANIDLPPGEIYYVAAGQYFECYVGYLEQYLRPDQGWDYYQILPRDAQDYECPPTATTTVSWGGIKALYR